MFYNYTFRPVRGIAILVLVVGLGACKLDEVPIDCPQVLSINTSEVVLGGYVELKVDNMLFDDPSDYRLFVGETVIPIDSVNRDSGIIAFNAPQGMGSGLISLSFANFPTCDGDTASMIDVSYQLSVVDFYIVAGMPGIADTAYLDNPIGLTLDPSGSFLFIADKGNSVVKMLDIPKDVLSCIAGFPDFVGCMSNPDDGKAASFREPYGLDFDPVQNRIVVSDLSCATVSSVDFGAPFGVRNVSGIPDNVGLNIECDSGSVAQFGAPLEVAISEEGMIFIADIGNNMIRTIDPQNNNETCVLAGVGNPECFSIDGESTEARFCRPWGITLNEQDELLYVTESSAMLPRIRTVDMSGTVKSLTPAIGSDDPVRLEGITNDNNGNNGNLYIADKEARKILRYDLQTNLLRALDLPFPVEGQAEFAAPTGVVYDTQSDILYISDQGAHVVYAVQFQ